MEKYELTEKQREKWELIRDGYLTKDGKPSVLLKCRDCGYQRKFSKINLINNIIPNCAICENINNNKWEIIKDNIGSDNYNAVISRCRCKHCGYIKNILRMNAIKGIGICENCTELYIQSFIGLKLGTYIVTKYLYVDKEQREYMYELKCEICGDIRISTLNVIKWSIERGENLNVKDVNNYILIHLSE